MKIRALLVDGEPPAWQGLLMLLQKEPEAEVVGECASGKEALEAGGAGDRC